MFGQLQFQTSQRVIGNIEPQHFSLKGKLVPFGEFWSVGNLRMFFGKFEHVAKEIDLPQSFIALEADGRLDGILVDLDQGTSSVTHGVKGTGLNQGFQGLLVGNLCRNFLQEVVKSFETSLVCTSSFDVFDNTKADIANCTHAESNILTYSRENTI